MAIGNKIKIIFDLDSEQWHASATETMWAEVQCDGLRRIDNIPFLFYGISMNDIVSTVPYSGEIELFNSVVTKGGHSTYRILSNKKIASSELSRISELNCLYEIGMFGDVMLVAISVPPKSDVEKLYLYLTIGEKKGIWDFEEANFEH